MTNNGRPQPTVTELISSCQGLVRSIAWKIHQKLPATVDLDDLIGYGQIGLAEAARDFDTSRGTQFTTYAYYRIRGAVLDGLSRMSWFSRAEYAAGRYEQAANDILTGEGARTAESDEVDWFSRTTRSLGMAFVMTHFVNGTAESTIADQRTPGDTVETSDLCDAVRRLLDELPEQEQCLIRGIYFEGLSIKDAGERINISKAWASRLHARVLERLAARLTTGAA